MSNLVLVVHMYSYTAKYHDFLILKYLQRIFCKRCPCSTHSHLDGRTFNVLRHERYYRLASNYVSGLRKLHLNSNFGTTLLRPELVFEDSMTHNAR